jgi:geranylgeranyl pyrophosphate synthase
MSIEQLIEPVEYYKSLKGKNIRSIFIQHIGVLFGIDSSDIKQVDSIINTIHNASLVIDDIQDDSLLRRGHTCAHIVYGTPLSINAGYLSLFQILTECDSNYIKHYIYLLYLSHIGQGMDIYYTSRKIIPSESDFLLMIEYKTGLLFKCMIDLLIDKTNNTLLKKKKDELHFFFTLFSYYFQIRDDYINLTSPSYWKDKGFCQDFDEEKISYLVMYYINHKLPNHENLLQMIHNSKHNDSLKYNILVLFHTHHVFDIVYDKLIELKMNLLNILNVNFIMDELPVERFQLQHAQSYL